MIPLWSTAVVLWLLLLSFAAWMVLSVVRRRDGLPGEGAPAGDEDEVATTVRPD